MTKHTSMRRAAKNLVLVAGLMAVSMWPAAALAAATVTGTITYDGKVPALKPRAMDADPARARLHSMPAPNVMLGLGSGNTMANILVWVSKGVPAGQTWPAPKNPAALAQKGCHYFPHV